MSYTRLADPSVGFDTTAQTPLQRALRACRKQFFLVGVFSGVVNLLQLTTSVYMMQVFDRVLASRILDTLYFLSLIAIVATLVLALLEAVRGQVMQRLATWVEHRVAPEGFVRAIESWGGVFTRGARRPSECSSAHSPAPFIVALSTRVGTARSPRWSW